MKYEDHKRGYIVIDGGKYLAVFVPHGGGCKRVGLFDTIEEAREALDHSDRR